MEFRIAETLKDSLARLTGDEQKAAKTTAFDLQMNPASPGMRFHRVDRAKDPRFWSVRVGRDLRLIVHKTDASLLLCYVSHHDDAYRWAERRKIERHPRTGAAQLVEIRETVREIAVPRYLDLERQPAVPLPLFADVSLETLLGYGVPTEWVDDVRHATEDSLLDLAGHLPNEAAEALVDLATGGTPTPAVTTAADVDPFEHPDARRRFRVMTTAKQLTRELDAPRTRRRHFCAKLTVKGGPPPFDELERVACVGEQHPGVTWLATRKRGDTLRVDAGSTCLAFAVAKAGRVRLLRGRIVGRTEELPSDGLLFDMYQGQNFPVFWQLCDVTLQELDGLHQIPGVSLSSGKSASEAFGRTSLTFTYWRLEDTTRRDETDTSVRVRSGTVENPTGKPTPERPSSGRQRVGSRGGPRVSLHGVDFSGARETGGRNPKLWIGSWEAGGDAVSLDWGGADERGFTRTALGTRIAGEPGLWVLDFPFGPASDIASVMNWTRWTDYVAWCTSRPDATELRNEARQVAAAGGRWSVRRRVDRHNRTTWFPFFEQLYRQTIRGAADVLSPLAARSRDEVRVFPWHGDDPAGFASKGAAVIEGFPGGAIGSLGLAATGYKGPKASHKDRRRTIVRALKGFS